jgi:hypothetical protein
MLPPPPPQFLSREEMRRKLTSEEPPHYQRTYYLQQAGRYDPSQYYDSDLRFYDSRPPMMRPAGMPVPHIPSSNDAMRKLSSGSIRPGMQPSMAVQFRPMRPPNPLRQNMSIDPILRPVSPRRRSDPDRKPGESKRMAPSMIPGRSFSLASIQTESSQMSITTPMRADANAEMGANPATPMRPIRARGMLVDSPLFLVEEIEIEEHDEAPKVPVRPLKPQTIDVPVSNAFNVSNVTCRIHFVCDDKEDEEERVKMIPFQLGINAKASDVIERLLSQLQIDSGSARFGLFEAEFIYGKPCLRLRMFI